MNERPDGSSATAIGWILVALGVIASFFVASAETPIGFWFSIGLANLGIGLGVLLLSLGYLVRAIWFLPGREVEIAQQPRETHSAYSGPNVQLETGECEFCGKVIKSPAKPCSSFSDDELPGLGSRVTNEECKSELKFRGYLSE